MKTVWLRFKQWFGSFTGLTDESELRYNDPNELCDFQTGGSTKQNPSDVDPKGSSK